MASCSARESCNVLSAGRGAPVRGRRSTSQESFARYGDDLVTKKESKPARAQSTADCASNKFAVPRETMNDRATHIGGREMEMRSNEARMTARLRLVEEHVRLENLHDLGGILGTFGPDARYDDEPWDDHRIGRDQVQLYYKELLAAAADFRIEVRNRYATDEAVILEVTVSGTHTGAWRDLPPTGKPISFPLCGIFTFDSEDRILGEKIYYDRATLLRQLGVFREPTSMAGRFLTAVNHPLTIAGAFGRRLIGN
jgi:steroid delta-isomerase-like uncharacterized protein